MITKGKRSLRRKSGGLGAPGHAPEDSQVESKTCKTNGLNKNRREKVDFSEGRHCRSSLDMGVIIHPKRHESTFT